LKGKRLKGCTSYSAFLACRPYSSQASAGLG